MNFAESNRKKPHWERKSQPSDIGKNSSTESKADGFGSVEYGFDLNIERLDRALSAKRSVLPEFKNETEFEKWLKESSE